MADGTPKNALPPNPSFNIRRSGGETINGEFYAHNEVSGFLDAGFIYGANAIENDAVRGPKVDGKMWLKPFTVDLSRVLGLPAGSQASLYTENNMLPLLTETGLPTDIGSLGQNVSLVFSAGDSRVSENLIITSLQTIWAREHNRQAAQVKAANPTWNDEQIFQKARILTTATYQHITYNEYLPTVWGHRNFNTHIGAYRGYKPDVEGHCGASFSGAAMRVGHSTVKQNVTMYTGCGAADPTLAFDGQLVQAGQGGAGPFAANPGEILGLSKGVTNVLQAAIFNKAEEGDTFITDTLRNILINNNAATGVDVSVANIRRGRMNSVPNFHTLRMHYHPLRNRKIYETHGCPTTADAPGPDPLGCFTKFIESVATATKVRDLYGKVTNIDAYVGILVEKKEVRDSLFGPTGTGIVLDQFRVSRDGDRFYYENLPKSLLSTAEKRVVERTTFAQVIKRNSDVVTINDNAFVAPKKPDRQCRNNGHGHDGDGHGHDDDGHGHDDDGHGGHDDGHGNGHH